MQRTEFPEEEIYEESFSRTRSKKDRKVKRVRTPIEQEHLELRNVVPRTVNQKSAFDSFDSGANLLLHGVAGTGKTFLATYLALRTILEGGSRYKRLIFIRSAVQGREQGFMPGKDQEKMAPYEDPYHLIFAELFNRGDAYQILKRRRTVQFASTSFLRGVTLADAIVVPDEIQNMDAAELHTIITRLGKNTKLIMCGDHRQDDLSGKKGQQSGIKEIVRVLDRMNGIRKVEFGIEDVQRSGFVKEYLHQRLKLGLDVPLDV